MTRSAVLPALLFVAALAGCTDAPADAAADEATTPLDAESTAPQLIEWDGHIVHSALDPLAHMRDPEGVLFPAQQAGFLIDIPTAPAAIEVMVSWDDADAGFVLHPHYKAEDDPALGGGTLYYGYLSDMFDASPGCVRIPAEDMAAGIWPMMIHPRSGTMDVDYTITVAIWGAEGSVLDEMHGHRSDGEAPVEDHGVEACQGLVADAPPIDAAA